MIAKEVAQILLDFDAVQVSLDCPFTWTSGIISPVYCDNRILISFPQPRNRIIDGCIQTIQENNICFDVLASTATAGIPWGAFLAQKLNCPMVYVRPQPKDHGAGKQVEGKLLAKQKVLVIEDLISTGKSSLQSARACEREGGVEIVGILSLFSYGFPLASEAFDQAGVDLWSLSNFSVLSELLDISDDQRRGIQKFITNPTEDFRK